MDNTKYLWLLPQYLGEHVKPGSEGVWEVYILTAFMFVKSQQKMP